MHLEKLLSEDKDLAPKSFTTLKVLRNIFKLLTNLFSKALSSKNVSFKSGIKKSDQKECSSYRKISLM